MAKRSRKAEKHNTHYIPDIHTKANLLRLTQKDRWITHQLGGVLTEQTDPCRFHRVLDIGSGTGSWVIDTALEYPTMSLVGIEIDPYLVNYAREEAEAAQVGGRATFRPMDALQPFDFPDASFDLVNLRLGGTFLRTWDWPKLLREIMRVLKGQGMLRLTDMELLSQSNSAASLQMTQLLANAFFGAGHFFEPKADGLTAHLNCLLREQGYQQIQTKVTTVITRSQGVLRREIHNYFVHALPAMKAFICKWGNADPQEYEQIYQQIMLDAPQTDFYSETSFFVIWGIKDISE